VDFLKSGVDLVQTKPFALQALLAIVPHLVAHGVKSIPDMKLRTRRVREDLLMVEAVASEEYFVAIPVVA